MKLALFSSSGNSGSSSGGKSKKAEKKKSRSLSRSDPPSFGSVSSSSSSEPSTTPTTVLSAARTQPRPRPLVIGRNASCLDAEYCVTPNNGTTDLPAARTQPRPRTLVIGRNASFLDAEYCATSKDIPAAVSKLRLGEDGKLSREELEDALRRLDGSGLDELPEIFDAAGERISLEELLALLRPKQVDEMVDDEEEELRAAFEVYDENGDGKISAEELHRVLRQLGDELCTVEDCSRMIRVVDSDGDGFVCFKDFSRMMTINGRR